ncbi:carboxylesterase family protein [Kribbella sp. NBC_01505]|uniref:carboxylesterase/lipase family protein n=1 Tax=Kribbella sp. NBC_01505 TaxID=2903580 RepID=UPI00386CF7B5
MMKSRLIAGGTVLAALAAVTLAGPSAAETTSGPVTLTDRGAVRGVDQNGVRTFQGISYAAPPVGALRWKAPQRAAVWTGVRDATKPGSKCVQLDGSGSEDCLFLNVTAPTKPSRPRPVMVWVHGGAFTMGSGSDYDAAKLATRGDVVVVTINYRLGVFGFFGHPALQGEGDFGLQDQQAALRWVKHNAAFFGGDPGNVTLFGESAGGMSTCSQLTAPAAKGLFDKAIIESGSCRTRFPANGLYPTSGVYDPWQPTADVEAGGAEAATGLGCATDVLACLRGKSTAQLATADLMNSFSFVAYGTKTLPEKPSAALDAGRFARVPVIQGTNKDEMRLYVGGALAKKFEITPDIYTEFLLHGAFPDDVARVAAVYPGPDGDTAALVWAAALTDAGWTCQALKADQALAKHVPVYAYDFADRSAPNSTGLEENPAFPYGAHHGSELAYLFHLADLNPEQTKLSDQMVDYWTRFAHTSNPNHPGGVTWPRVTPHGAQAQELGQHAVRSINLSDAHNCGLWATVPYN